MPEHYPPGPAGDPLLGNLRPLMSDTLGFLAKLSREYADPLVYIKVPTRAVYLLNSPDTIQQVLVKDHASVRKGPALRNNTYPAFGDGLLTSEGTLHDRQRRLIQPALHSTRVESYAGIMVDDTARMLENWACAPRRDINADMMGLTMNIVARALFGADLWDAQGALGEAVGRGMEILGRRIAKPPALRMPDFVPTPENRLRKRILTLLNGTIYGIIEQRRAHPPADDAEQGADLLALLLAARDEDGSRMTDRQLRDEVMTLFLAGHETTANVLSWTFWLVATHPAVQQRMADEAAAVLGERAPTLADVALLTYTEQVFKEGLRLYPPAWATSRQTTAPLEIAGYPIAPGSTLVISPYALHRSPHYFEQPDCFLPERFAPDARASIPRYAYLPFGAGPRGCVGTHFAMLEAVIILVMTVQRYRLEPLPGHSPQPHALITLRPRGGLPLLAQPKY